MNELVKIENNEKYGLVVSSRVIAKELGKRHDHVMRDLDKIKEGIPKFGDTPKNIIIPSVYVNPQNNQEYREFLLTKDGFILYMFNIQGYNDFKMAYINKFNEMEKQLKSLNIPSYQLEDPIERAKRWIVEQEEKQKLENKIKEDAPKVEFYNDVADSSSTMDIAKVAKTLNIKGIGRNKLFEILREEKILRKNNEPYQRYIDEGWFKLIETKWNKNNGEICIGHKTVVFQKGVEKIANLLKRNELYINNNKIGVIENE